MINSELSAKVSPESLTSYLSNTGWIAASDVTDRFRFEKDNAFTIDFPLDRSAYRYGETVFGALKTLSSYEERELLDIYERIMNPSTDSLSFAFRGPQADKGTLPLDYLYESIGNIKDSIAYSVCSELQPQPYYKRKKKEAVEVAKSARFGQTKIGSFVLNVILPHTSSQLFEPMERKAVKRILIGLQQARDVVTGQAKINYTEDFKTGLNANLAESLSNLVSTGYEIGIAVKWDSKLEITSDFKKISEIILEEKTIEVLKTISIDYRSQNINEAVRINRATILSLTWKDIESDEDENSEDRVAYLKIIEPDNIPAEKIHVSLTTEDYKKACDIHKEAGEISLSGTLYKKGNQWWIRNYSSFQKKR